MLANHAIDEFEIVNDEFPSWILTYVGAEVDDWLTTSWCLIIGHSEFKLVKLLIVIEEFDPG
jgi:hypothetical protein